MGRIRKARITKSRYQELSLWLDNWYLWFMGIILFQTLVIHCHTYVCMCRVCCIIHKIANVWHSYTQTRTGRVRSEVIVTTWHVRLQNPSLTINKAWRIDDRSETRDTPNILYCNCTQHFTCYMLQFFEWPARKRFAYVEITYQTGKRHTRGWAERIYKPEQTLWQNLTEASFRKKN